MPRLPKYRFTFRNIIAGIGGLLFLIGAIFLTLFTIVAIVLLIQGESPSPFVLATCVGIMLVGWALVAMTGKKLRYVLTVVSNP